MPYADLTFQVQPGLRFVPNDFVNVYVPTTSTTTTATPTTTTTTTPPPTTTTTTTPTPTTTTTTTAGGGIVTTGLMFNFDAANYPGTGSTWTDSVNSNVGTLIASPTYSTNNGGYFNFDGSNNYVTVPHNSTLSFNPYLTLEAWIYPTADNYNMIITKQPSGGQPSPYPGNYELRLQPSSAMGFGWQYDYPSQYGYAFFGSNNNVLTLNAWNQVVVTSQTVSNTKFYVNGSLISVTVQFNYPPAQSSPPMAVNNQPLLLGRRQDGLPFAGRYAIARGYNVMLDASQVLQNFNAIKSRFGL